MHRSLHLAKSRKNKRYGTSILINISPYIHLYIYIYIYNFFFGGGGGGGEGVNSGGGGVSGEYGSVFANT